MPRGALLALACLTWAPPLHAQAAQRAGISAPSPAELARGDLTSAHRGNTQPGRNPPSLLAVAASLVLPGAGQALLGQERFVPYSAVEGFFLLRYFQHSRDARRERDRYRALAANVARAPFSSDRRHGSFEYYESMESFLESGAFDAIPGGALDPEPDTTTFNGKIWLLARRTFWREPSQLPPRDSREWRQAESFYLSRAVRPEFRWSWRDAQLEYDEFRRTIRRSNDAFRDALADLGVIIANHALSGVDALVSVRLLSRAGEHRRWLLRAEVPLR